MRLCAAKTLTNEKSFITARAENRQKGALKRPRTHRKWVYKIHLRWKTLRALQLPRAGRTLEELLEPVRPLDLEGDAQLRRDLYLRVQRSGGSSQLGTRMGPIPGGGSFSPAKKTTPGGENFPRVLNFGGTSSAENGARAPTPRMARGRSVAPDGAWRFALTNEIVILPKVMKIVMLPWDAASTPETKYRTLVTRKIPKKVAATTQTTESVSLQGRHFPCSPGCEYPSAQYEHLPSQRRGSIALCHWSRLVLGGLAEWKREKRWGMMGDRGHEPAANTTTAPLTAGRSSHSQRCTA